MKKFAVFAVVFVMLFQTILGSSFFIDVDEASTEGRAIVKMAERKIVNGVGDGYFRPDDSLTRAQFVKIVNNVFGYTHMGENKFADVLENKWYYKDVSIAVEAGYINGTGNGQFKPEDKVSREQACVILNNILKMELLPYYTKPKDKLSHWAEDAVCKALSNGLVSLEEGEIFRGTEIMTRAEACIVLSKCIVDVGPVKSIDLETIAKEELLMRMTRVITAMKEKVVCDLENEKSKQVSYKIVENMEAYLKDNTHDYVKASKDTFEIYRTIPKSEREIFKSVIQKYNKLEDLMLLYDFFFIM